MGLQRHVAIRACAWLSKGEINNKLRHVLKCMTSRKISLIILCLRQKMCYHFRTFVRRSTKARLNNDQNTFGDSLYLAFAARNDCLPQKQEAKRWSTGSTQISLVLPNQQATSRLTLHLPFFPENRLPPVQTISFVRFQTPTKTNGRARFSSGRTPGAVTRR